MEFLLYRSIGNQWPLMCQECTSFADPSINRTTIGSPKYARNIGVSGSPWIRLLNNCDGSGLFASRTDKGSTRML